MLNYWCHMDYFNDVLTTFVGSWLNTVVWKLSDFTKNIFICVQKMNEGIKFFYNMRAN